MRFARFLSRTGEVVTDAPAVIGAVPRWGFDLGNPAVHADLPADPVKEPVVVPAQQDAVVGVRTAPGMFGDVVDLAPTGRNAAAGDDAPAVAKGDRAALVPVEDASSVPIATIRRPPGC
jgi:hypothetical protein